MSRKKKKVTKFKYVKKICPLDVLRTTLEQSLVKLKDECSEFIVKRNEVKDIPDLLSDMETEFTIALRQLNRELDWLGEMKLRGIFDSDLEQQAKIRIDQWIAHAKDHFSDDEHTDESLQDSMQESDLNVGQLVGDRLLSFHKLMEEKDVTSLLELDYYSVPWDSPDINHYVPVLALNKASEELYHLTFKHFKGWMVAVEILDDETVKLYPFM